MISRRKDYIKKNPSKDSHKIYIICEGTDTEPCYFKFFENLSSNLQIITIPPKYGTDPLKLMELAEQILSGENRIYTVDYAQNDKVWFVIDTDSWEIEGKITPLRNFCSDKNAGIHKTYDEIKPYSAWNVAQSNPCFEIWLYYHFYQNKPQDDEVEECSSFKDFVNKTINGGFNYDHDQTRLADAITNAEANFTLKDTTPSVYSSEMYLLGKEIYSFVKTELEKLRNKLG